MRSWLIASRPKTLPAAIVPVVIGTAMAWKSGGFHGDSAFLALFCALMIQVGTNFVNDYWDFKKGTDTESRKGPLRVSQAGLINPETLKKAAIIVFALAVIGALYLIKRGGVPIVVIGALSILSGIFYTAGPKPFGYMGLGEAFVFIFFGPVAVWGTWFVQTLNFSDPAPVIAGVATGLYSVAILVVNNIRDEEGDRKSGKKSLVVRFGRKFGITEYYTAITLGSLIPFIMVLMGYVNLGVFASFSPLFFPRSLKAVGISWEPDLLNRALEDTGKMLLVFGFLFSAGWLIQI